MSDDSPTADSRCSAPSAGRNREPILQVLRKVLPQSGTVLEVAAGTGEHAVFFSRAFPHLDWWPTDIAPENLASIESWRTAEGGPNLQPARRLDVLSEEWPVSKADALVCINMIHIAPWECTEGLMAGAGRVLSPRGILVTYGPYRVDGAHTAPSNVEFEAWLKGKDPRFGVRDVGDVAAEAAARGLSLEQRIEMPANNFTLVFQKS